MINKWQTKPVIVEVAQWTGYNTQEMEEFGIVVSLQSLEPGSYIVKEGRERFKVYTPDAFYDKFERLLVWDTNI